MRRPPHSHTDLFKPYTAEIAVLIRPVPATSAHRWLAGNLIRPGREYLLQKEDEKQQIPLFENAVSDLVSDQ